jgi:hypothetical protein
VRDKELSPTAWASALPNADETRVGSFVERIRSEARRAGLGGATVVYFPTRRVIRLCWSRGDRLNSEVAVDIPATEHWVLELTNTLARLRRARH